MAGRNSRWRERKATSLCFLSNYLPFASCQPRSLSTSAICRAIRTTCPTTSSFHPDFLANFPRPSQRLISLLLSVLCSSPSFCFSLIFFRFLSRSLAHFLPNSRRSQKSSPTRRHSVLSFFLVSLFFVGRFRRLENCESRQRMSPYITFKLFN